MSESHETNANDGAPEREAQEKLTARVGTTLEQRKPSNLSLHGWKRRLRQRRQDSTE
jgi:hypothetical protein